MDYFIIMRFKIGCVLSYEVYISTTFIFNISAEKNEYQNILKEKLTVDPILEIKEFSAKNNLTRSHMLFVEKDKFDIAYEAEVEISSVVHNVDDAAEIHTTKLPHNVIEYLYPSRYCESDKLIRITQKEFANIPSGFSRVTAICNWIYENVEYLFGTTGNMTSAYDTVAERAGVCRDFAHLGIALCRALGIPARFCSSYAYGLNPPDFHAYFEAYLGNSWYIFDPTRLAPQTSFVKIGTGHDAADLSFATIIGNAEMKNIEITMDSISTDENNNIIEPKFTTKPITSGHL